MGADWTGKTVVVTGGGGGMGAAAARRFADAGARVFALGRTMAALERAAQGHVGIVPFECDVADPESVDAALAESGPPDAVVHTAGVNTPDRAMAHEDPSKVASLDSWKRVLDINVLGVVNVVQAASTLMAANGGGRVVVVTSTAGHGYDSYAGVPYTASKWAVHGLLFTARQQLGRQGVVLSEYAPGEANTPIVDKRPVLPGAEHRAAMIQSDDCAEALFFIASQPHCVSLVQLPIYQPFGGMPPEIASPWLESLRMGAP